MIGKQFGPWVLEWELGRGGMAGVWLARAEPPPEGCPPVAAVKVLSGEMAGDPEFLTRFRREIEALSRLNHPGIVRLYGSGIEEGRPFFAMEYVEGPTLQTVLEQRGRLPWQEAVDIALRLAPALKHAHAHGVVHRDLKPANILLASGGRNAPGAFSPGESAPGRSHAPLADAVPKITDFGVASLFAARGVTLPGHVVGTAAYVSPEQAAGKPATKRSDLYALGVVLYQMLTGRTPFQGETLDLLHKQRYAQPERPARLVPDLPPDLDNLVCQLLEKDPERRPADAHVLQRALERLVGKQERKAAAAVETSAEDPAKLMSRLMRAELEAEKRGGPVKRLFNRPIVVIPLFLLSLGLLIWLLWPSSPATLYGRGEALMQSDNPDDWEKAWDDYLEPLQRKHPDYRKEEVAEFKKKVDAARAVRRAERVARLTEPPSEAQWFYQRGLRLRQEGREEEARKVWQGLVAAFDGVPAEKPWVRLARDRLAEDAPDGKRDWDALREAVRRAKSLRQQGKEGDARKILDGLEALYGGDKAVKDEIARELADEGGRK
jgi:eukaryotic-like serine/threonine-protein kinase